MWKFFKLIVGIGMWPLAWAVSASTYVLCSVETEAFQLSSNAAWALPAGFLAWVAIFYLLPRPLRTYVLGHELTHALWAMLMGGRVRDMKVGRAGGHVELSKSNFIIALAPYFFPFYTGIVICAYLLAGIWIDVQSAYPWWMAAVGLTWSFHFTFTIQMLSQHQPDIQEHGRIFSFTIIYLMNVLMIALLVIGFGNLQAGEFGGLFKTHVQTAYGNAWDWIDALRASIMAFAKSIGQDH